MLPLVDQVRAADVDAVITPSPSHLDVIQLHALMCITDVEMASPRMSFARWTTFPVRWGRYEYRGGLGSFDDEAVARECLKVCTDRIAELQEMFVLVRQTKTVSGFGDFVMANDLMKKFAEQGIDIETSIREHIETVMNMQEVMRLSLSKLVGQDVDNAGNITGSV